MTLSALLVVSTIGFCAAIAAVGVALYSIVGFKRHSRSIDQRLSATEKLIPDVRTVLNQITEHQTTNVEILAKAQGEAMAKILQNQSEINKDHKTHIENLLKTVAWHGKILNFETDVVGTPVTGVENEDTKVS
jgi:hypothetical protein